MEGVTIIETELLYRLIDSIETLHKRVKDQLELSVKPYLTTKDVCELLGKSENWVSLHKEDLGYSKRTGTLLFKRKDIEAWIDEDYCSPNKLRTRL